jgi:transcriptional regulator with GAF, ATPase, and Fis domain
MKVEVSAIATSRELLVARTFVQLADTLEIDFDLIDLLTLLADRTVEILDAAASGILIAGRSRRLSVMAASDERSELLELFQIQAEEGPCLDSFTTGELVFNSDLREVTPWPRVAAESVRVGFLAVCAVPMRLRDEVVGCLNLFMSDPVRLADADVALAQAFADISSIAIVQDGANRQANTRIHQLQHALDSRVLIEQAKGMIAEHESITMQAAFLLLRTFARNNNVLLTETAGNLVEGRLSFDALTQPHVRHKSN